MILLKLDSDKSAKLASKDEVTFRSCATPAATGSYLRDRFIEFIDVYPDIFLTESDKEIRFSDSTIHDCVEVLSPLKLLDAGPESVSIAFQVLRSAALKQEEGQYFTPWAFSLKEVREQWRRITLMQTNREDVGNRYGEILIPKPKTTVWAHDVSEPFRKYFTTIADSKVVFAKETNSDQFSYIASISAFSDET